MEMPRFRGSSAVHLSLLASRTPTLIDIIDGNFTSVPLRALGKGHRHSLLIVFKVDV
ncbi:hypothetical protein CDV31_017287, partial [Fusarium ambrosium]